MRKQITLELWRITEAPYGTYNRYAIGYSTEYGTIEGAFRETDCDLPLNEYENTLVQAEIEQFYSGRVLIAAIKQRA